jgi:hypothetical protein
MSKMPDPLTPLREEVARIYDQGYRDACTHSCGCLKGETPESHERDAFLALLQAREGELVEALKAAAQYVQAFAAEHPGSRAAEVHAICEATLSKLSGASHAK